MDVSSLTMGKGVLELDSISFQQLTSGSDKIVIVEFYLSDCPVCQAMEPMFQALSQELAEDAIFGKIDAQANLDLALQYGVVGTPTFKLFCKDRFLGEIIGETNATVLRNTIKDIIRHQSCGTNGRKHTFELDGYG